MVKWLIKNIERPLLMNIRGWSEQLKYEKFVKQRLSCSIEDNLKLQRQKLFDLIRDAIENVPYYKQIAQENEIHPTLKTIHDDLRKFPILTKDIIRERFVDLKSVHPGGNIISNTSGGSTGVPVKFLQDKRYMIENPTLILDGFCGYESGDKLVQLWGSERDIIQGSVGLKNKLLNAVLYRKLMLNTFHVADADMHAFVEKINRFKPSYMLAYVQSAHALACFIEREQLKMHQLKGIIVSAGTLYDDFREKIEHVFKCPVFNRYGSREVGNMAMECEAHEGMHLNLFGQYMEIIDQNERPVPSNEMGRILITSLTNHTMPLIRFEIGDMAVPTDHVCACGRGLPLIKTVKGRTVNIFKTRNGAQVDGEYFTHLFYNLDFVRQFQVVQEDYEKIVVHYVLSKAVEPDVLDTVQADMRQKIWLVMGEDCEVIFRQADDILPTASGKFVYTISNI